MDLTLTLPPPLRGLVLGFLIAATVGPITLLTVRRTIEHGRVYGLASGLGVATADASYAGIAAFGLTAITGILVAGHTVLGIVGGVVIAVLGLRTMSSRPGAVARDRERPGLVGAFASIYALTMTNPLTILAFAAAFAGLGVAAGAGFADAAILTAAVWAGSALWWVLLTAVVGWLRHRITPTVLAWVNRLSGAALVVLGLLAVLAAVH